MNAILRRMYKSKALATTLGLRATFMGNRFQLYVRSTVVLFTIPFWCPKGPLSKNSSFKSQFALRVNRYNCE